MSPLTDAALAQHASSQTEPSGEVEQADDLAAVLRALDDLPPPQQEVIRLKFQHGLSYREIAAVTEQPIGTVGYLIHVGLQTIRQVVVPQA